MRQCTEDVFHRLYPTEPEMHLSAMQNEFHSDIPLNYQVGDVLADAGLIFAVEEENASKCFSRYILLFHMSVSVSGKGKISRENNVVCFVCCHLLLLMS